MPPTTDILWSLWQGDALYWIISENNIQWISFNYSLMLYVCSPILRSATMLQEFVETVRKKYQHQRYNFICMYILKFPIHVQLLAWQITCLFTPDFKLHHNNLVHQYFKETPIVKIILGCPLAKYSAFWYSLQQFPRKQISYCIILVQ